MQLTDILAMWKEDAKISEFDLDRESLKIPQLHSKYLDLLMEARRGLRVKQIEHDRMHGLLCQYYRGELNNKEDLDRIKRTPWPIKIKYQNLDEYIRQDKSYIAANVMLLDWQNRVEALEEIIKTIHNRSFHIGRAVEFVKIKSGM